MTDKRRARSGDATAYRSGDEVLRSHRWATGPRGAGFVGRCVSRGCGEPDMKQTKRDGLDERRGCEDRADAAVPETASGKIVMRFRYFVSRCWRTGLGGIRSQTQGMRTEGDA
jgi:hypothetical protein